MIDSHGQSLKTGGEYVNSAFNMGFDLDPLSDNALMIKVRNGDLEKLGLLFERYKKILFSYFYNLSRDREISEDHVQTVFIRVLKYKHAYRGDGSFKSWIFHIARNVQADHWKKEKKNGYKVPVEDIDGESSESDGWEQKEPKIRRLESAMNRLPDEQKELLTLAKLKGIKYREIAEMMNWTESNVKIKVFRALRTLKDEFENLEKLERHG